MSHFFAIWNTDFNASESNKNCHRARQGFKIYFVSDSFDIST
jgi:hypothetical protein